MRTDIHKKKNRLDLPELQQHMKYSVNSMRTDIYKYMVIQQYIEKYRRYNSMRTDIQKYLVYSIKIYQKRYTSNTRKDILAKDILATTYYIFLRYTSIYLSSFYYYRQQACMSKTDAVAALLQLCCSSVAALLQHLAGRHA